MVGYNTPDNGRDRSVKVGHEIKFTNAQCAKKVDRPVENISTVR